MSSLSAYVYRSIAECDRAVQDGTLTPLDLTQALLRRIEEVDPRVGAYVHVMAESALEEAHAATERARQGRRLSRIDGLGMAVKDLFDTAGVVTAAGVRAYADRIPESDATCVRLLREAGAVILGKTNMDELAAAGTTTNEYFGATHNPWDLERVPGGSSGGSAAALAVGECLGALGTDTSGSIRIPAAFCSVTGHKPTYGLVGRGGVVPAVQTMDHAGPMARTVEDCAILLEVLAVPDPRDPASAPVPSVRCTEGLTGGVQGLRLAVIPSLLDGLEDAVANNFERSLDVLRGLGASVDRCEPMEADGDWRAPMAPLVPAELAGNFAALSRQHPGAIRPRLAERLQAATAITAVDYMRALRQRELIELRFEEALKRFDAFVVPTTPITAEPIGGEEPVRMKFRNTVVFDYSRQPATAVPNGFDTDGLPTSVMFATAKWTDDKCLRIAHAYQEATDYHLRRPSV